MEAREAEVFARIRALGPRETDQLILDLADYASALIGWKTRWMPRGQLPHGYDAGALALEAIARILDGRRKWNPAVEPDLLPYLKSVVKSILSELMPAAEREVVEEASVDEAGIDLVESAPTDNPTPEESMELEELKKTWLGGFQDASDRRVLMCMLDGNQKAADIASELELDVEEVYRIKRKIKRGLLRLGYGE